jgi:rSAM/selenodomain-associated transferase 1
VSVPSRRLLLFTKPAKEGRVKTRLIGDLSAAEAAALHAAFLADLLDRLREGDFDLRLAWALEPHEDVPAGPLPGIRQRGDDLGERLYLALSEAAREAAVVGALGSDHPTLPLDLVHLAFARVEAGADVVLGPAADGGYYLIALAAGAVSRRLFEEIAWSTESVFRQTIERAGEIGLDVHRLPVWYDVDDVASLRRLIGDLAAPDHSGYPAPHTSALLRRLAPRL